MRLKALDRALFQRYIPPAIFRARRPVDRACPATSYMAHFRSLSLRTRIVLLVVVLLMAGVWGLAVRVTTVMQDDLEQQLSGQLSATIRFVTDDMDRDVEMRFEALKRIAAAITPDLLSDQPGLQEYLEQRQMVRAIFNMNLMVLSRSGIIMADYPLV
ncbi:MAG TPA: hypothetical protein VLN59_04715, partial [Burkholderiales bacterium]|nr:hypothetical protein [Burkholderiales bacterium]